MFPRQSKFLAIYNTRLSLTKQHNVTLGLSLTYNYQKNSRLDATVGRIISDEAHILPLESTRRKWSHLPRHTIAITEIVH